MGNDPEEFVKAAQHRPRVATLQHSELLSEREVLQDEMPTAMKHASERSDPEKEHGVIRGRTLQYVTDSTVRESFGEPAGGIPRLSRDRRKKLLPNCLVRLRRSDGLQVSAGPSLMNRHSQSRGARR